MGWQLRRTYLFISFTCYQASFLGLQSHEQTISQSPHCFTFFFFSMTISGSCPCQFFLHVSIFVFICQLGDVSDFPPNHVLSFSSSYFWSFAWDMDNHFEKKGSIHSAVANISFFYWVYVNFFGSWLS